jgi:anti-sigma B factor antagonist
MNYLATSHSSSEGIGSVVVSGEVDAQSAQDLREQMLSLLGKGICKILVNLNQIRFIDSTGLGILVGGLKRARERGGDLVIVSNNGAVNRLLELTGLHQIFRVLPSEDTALEYLRNYEAKDGKW